jgi:hypothetical protein
MLYTAGNWRTDAALSKASTLPGAGSNTGATWNDGAATPGAA